MRRSTIDSVPKGFGAVETACIDGTVQVDFTSVGAASGLSTRAIASEVLLLTLTRRAASAPDRDEPTCHDALESSTSRHTAVPPDSAPGFSNTRTSVPPKLGHEVGDESLNRLQVTYHASPS